MVRKIAILVLTVIILLSFTSCGLKDELYDQTKPFYDIVNGTIPKDMRLTIYYVNYHYIHCMPYSVEMLMTMPDLSIINVRYEDLVKHQEHLSEFDLTLLEPEPKETFTDALVYYVFELDSGPVLEYVHSDMLGCDTLNGIQLKPTSELFDLIDPFLPEDSIYKNYDPLQGKGTRGRFA